MSTSLVVTTLAWIGAQARAHMNAKILYVEPDSSKGDKPEKTGHSS
jgi:ATP synthase protein I